MIAERRSSLLAAAALVALVASTSSASAWVCRADSRNAFGWGSSPRLAVAKQIALSQCAVRTPRGRYCRITACR